MRVDRNLLARINRGLAAECRKQGVPTERIHKVRPGYARREFGDYILCNLDGEWITHHVDVRLLARELGIRA